MFTVHILYYNIVCRVCCAMKCGRALVSYTRLQTIKFAKATYKKKRFLDSEQSDEAIGFTKMCVFFFIFVSVSCTAPWEFLRFLTVVPVFDRESYAFGIRYSLCFSNFSILEKLYPKN